MTTAFKHSDPVARAPMPPGVASLLPGVVIIIVVLAVYANSFGGAFLFDDSVHIVQNKRIQDLATMALLSGKRPTTDVSLAINYALGGLHPGGYHAFNLLVHLIAALTLYGVVRRTLLRDGKGAKRGRAATWLAATIALLWAVHPLQTQSVTYVIQRAESMMGMFYLLTLYCFIRGISGANEARAGARGGAGSGGVSEASDRAGARSSRWFAAAVIACALGMGSKAVMVTAPLVVLLYDSVFVSGSFLRALRRHGAVYLGLGATWGVLWACGIAPGVLTRSNEGAHIGFGYKGITPVDYALTQFGVIVEYLRLSLWPHPLCLDYNWPIARTLTTVVPAALVVAVLVMLSLRGIAARAALGFVGAWFFLILAPTSSVIPIKDTLFEHRMYLPLAGVVTLLVLGGHRLIGCLADRLLWATRAPWGGRLGPVANRSHTKRTTPTRVGNRLGPVANRSHTKSTTRAHVGNSTQEGHRARAFVSAVVVMVAVYFLGFTTARRNTIYHSPLTMWRDVVSKRPRNARAFENLGTVLIARAKSDTLIANERTAAFREAVEQYRRAVEIDPDFTSAHANLANALSEMGRPEEAVRHYEEVLRLEPNHLRARVNLGHALAALGRTEESIAAFRSATRIDARHTKPKVLANAHFNLGAALGRTGDLDGAETQYREAVRLWPEYEKARFGLGSLLMMRGHYAEAVEQFDRCLRINPDNVRARRARAQAQARLRS